MTTISIKILKTEETQEWAKYAFGGPPTRVIGQVKIYKSDGQVDLIEIEDKKYKKYILPAVTKTLHEHHKKNEYPDEVYYNS